MTGTVPVTVERLQGDLGNSDHATAQTVERMCEHIHQAGKDPLVMAIAKRALVQFPLPNASPRSQAAWAAWWTVKHKTQFIQDAGLFNRPLKFVDGRSAFVSGHNELEMLVSPAVMVTMQKPRGDCDDFVMMVCALLEVLNCPWEIVTVEANPNAPGEYSHVYAVGVLEDGRRIPLDASHGWGPGWEVPAEHTVRYQAWDQSARPVERKRSYKGLHGYQRRRRRRAGLRGLGDDSVDLSTLYPTDTTSPDVTGVTYSPSDSFTPGTPATSNTLANFLTGITSQGLNLVGKIVAPTATYVRGPNGQLMISAPAGANINPFAAQVPALGAGGSSLLYIGGGLLLLVVLMGALGKK
jgi:hypothetical protein